MMRARAIALSSALFFAALEANAVGVAVRVNRPHPIGTKVEFAANAVGEGDITYTWDFGDGERSGPKTKAEITHVYEKPGHYPVIVVAKDAAGARSDSFLQTIHRPLPDRAPVSSSTIVHHAALGRVCNVNADHDTVSCLSTDDHELLFEVPVGDHPRTLAVSPDGTLWVVNQDDASLSVLGESGELLGTLELPYRSSPFGIVIDAERGVGYVTLQALGEVAEVDLSSGEVLRRAAATPWSTAIALWPETGRLFVTRLISSPSGGEVVELNVDEFQAIRTFHLALDPGPDSEASARGVPNYLRSIVPSPDGSLIWVPSKKDNILRGEARDGAALTFETSVRSIVSMIDPGANKEILKARVDLNNRTLGLSLTFSPLGDYAFVALLGNNGVEILDAYSRNIVGGRLQLGQAPDGLVLDDAGRLYVNQFLSRSVMVLDAAPVLDSTKFTLESVAEVIVSTGEKLQPEVLAGKRLFYDAADPRMSKDGYISCAVCHLDGFEDGQVWDFTDRGEGLRNTTSLLGKRGTGHGRLHWSANFDELQDFEHDIRGPFGGTGFLDDDTFHQGSRDTTLGDKKAGQSEELDALAAYVTSLDHVPPSPHRDPDGSLSEAAWRGLALFLDSGCPSCHSGPDFTDSASGEVHDVGTLLATSGQRLGEPLMGLDTPTLRGLWQTAPYLHDGSALTLRDVLKAKNKSDLHGTTSHLNDGDLNDLVRYLSEIDNVAREDEVEPEAEELSAAREASDLERGGSGCAVVGGPKTYDYGWMLWLAALGAARIVRVHSRARAQAA